MAIADEAPEWIDALRNIGGAPSGNAGGSSGGSAATVGGGRAMGGPVQAGVPYYVGEAGKELFVPQNAGSIVPNHALAGAGAGGNTFNITVRVDGGEYDEERLAREVGKVVKRQAQGIGVKW